MPFYLFTPVWGKYDVSISWREFRTLIVSIWRGENISWFQWRDDTKILENVLYLCGIGIEERCMIYNECETCQYYSIQSPNKWSMYLFRSEKIYCTLYMPSEGMCSSWMAFAFAAPLLFYSPWLLQFDNDYGKMEWSNKMNPETQDASFIVL